MTPLFDELEYQLRGAAHSQVARRHSAMRRRFDLWRWLCAGGRALPVLAGIAAAAAIAVAAFVLLHSGPAPTVPGAVTGPPTLPQPPAGQELHGVQTLLQPALQSWPCRSIPRARAIAGEPSRALRDELAILRRPARRGDVPPVGILDSTSSPVYRDDARLARTVGHASFWVVPVRVIAGASQPTAACVAAERAALLRRAGLVPAAVRAVTVALAKRELDAETRRLRTPPSDQACLATAGGPFGGMRCDGLTAVPLSRPTMPFEFGTSAANRLAFLAVVPDGVATLTVRITRPVPSAHVGNVVGNVALVVARPEFLAAQAGTITWRNAHGHIIARAPIPSPPAGTFGSSAIDSSARLMTTPSG